MVNGELRTKVAVPLEVPVIKPSLIPLDVLQDVAREALSGSQPIDESALDEPQTAPVALPGELPLLGTVKADVEVAYFALTQVPLFKDLSSGSLEAMSLSAAQLEVPEGEFLFREGDDATSFFVVVDGTLELLRHKEGREVSLRHAQKGDAFGLFGLFSERLRAASARAIGDCTVMEIGAQTLQRLLPNDPLLHQRLLGFYRERVVEDFMASRIFADVDSVARTRLTSRFTHKELEPTQTLLNPGEVANLIAVITHGRLILEDRSKIGQRPREFEVIRGQYLIITSAISGHPSKLRVLAPEYATLSMLTHRDLHELLRDYPALRCLPSRLPNFARALDRDVFCGSTGLPGL